MMKLTDKQRSLAELKTTKRENTLGDSKFQSSMINNPMMYSKIAKLQETGQTYCQKKEIERDRLEQLNEEIKEASIRLEEKRKEIMEKKRSPKDDNPIRLEKKMKAMHLKIDNIRNKYNYADSQNRDLKEDINKLRREINLYKQIQKILSKRIQEAKKNVSDQSESAKNQDKMFEEGAKTLYKHQSEYQLQKKRYEKEFQSVYHVLGDENRDQRKREKFGIKGADGSVMKSQSPWSKSGSDFFKSHTQGFQDALMEKHGVGKGNKKHDKRGDGGQSLEQIKFDLDKYDEVLSLLVESCLNEKVDFKSEDKKKRNQVEQEYLRRIINTFADYEDKKNAIYQYINSLRDESEQLEKSKKEIEDEIEKYKKLPEQIKQDPKVQKCFDIQKQIEIIKRKRKSQEMEHKCLMLYINQLKMQIPVVFEKIGCDSEEYTRELGEEYGPFNYKDIDESNIIQYLAILEKRTNDLLQLQNQAFNNGKQGYSDQRKQKYAEESYLSLSNIGGKPLDQDLIGMLENYKIKAEDAEKEKQMFKVEEFQKQIQDTLKNKKRIIKR
ncbi:hypothetical protein ABPG72_022079 [Tetrahymena utriculariae]